jgi:hypothetical protein
MEMPDDAPDFDIDDEIAYEDNCGDEDYGEQYYDEPTLPVVSTASTAKAPELIQTPKQHIPEKIGSPIPEVMRRLNNENTK